MVNTNLIDKAEVPALKVKPTTVGTIATIGFFDGVHCGHRYLIEQVRRLKEERGRAMQSLIVTFAEHPRQVLQSDYVPQLLNSPDEKLLLLRQMPVDDVKMLHFTPELAQLTARQFMEQVLRAQFGVSLLVMGYDHGFGHGGGTWEEYVRWGRELGIEVVRALPLAISGNSHLSADVHPSADILPCANVLLSADVHPSADVHYNNIACASACVRNISSSVIRRMLTEGRVEEASVLLGHRYTMRGRVVAGHQVGRQLGFPTANLRPHPFKLIPMRGVYCVEVVLEDGGKYLGMLNIGERPTIDNSPEQSIEVHLLHFSGDLYGQTLTIEFVRFIRNEHRFASREELVNQMKRDRIEIEK